MSFFKKRTSVKIFSVIICELIRSRTASISKDLIELDVKYQPIILTIYTFFYNLIPIRNTLLQKYPSDTVDEITDGAYSFFRSSLEHFFGNKIEDLLEEARFFVNLMAEDDFDNIFSSSQPMERLNSICENYFEDIKSTSSQEDTSFIFVSPVISSHIISWLDNSFLNTSYKLSKESAKTESYYIILREYFLSSFAKDLDSYIQYYRSK